MRFIVNIDSCALREAVFLVGRFFLFFWSFLIYECCFVSHWALFDPIGFYPRHLAGLAASVCSFTLLRSRSEGLLGVLVVRPLYRSASRLTVVCLEYRNIFSPFLRNPWMFLYFPLRDLLRFVGAFWIASDVSATAWTCCDSCPLQ